MGGRGKFMARVGRDGIWMSAKVGASRDVKEWLATFPFPPTAIPNLIPTMPQI